VPVRGDGRLAGDVEIALEGVPVEEDRDAFIAEAVEAARRAVGAAKEEERLREDIRLAVRRCATEWTGKKPVVRVMLLRV
jgi:ribonuclease J